MFSSRAQNRYLADVILRLPYGSRRVYLQPSSWSVCWVSRLFHSLQGLPEVHLYRDGMQHLEGEQEGDYPACCCLCLVLFPLTRPLLLPTPTSQFPASLLLVRFSRELCTHIRTHTHRRGVAGRYRWHRQLLAYMQGGAEVGSQLFLWKMIRRINKQWYKTKLRDVTCSQLKTYFPLTLYFAPS